MKVVGGELAGGQVDEAEHLAHAPVAVVEKHPQPTRVHLVGVDLGGTGPRPFIELKLKLEESEDIETGVVARFNGPFFNLVKSNYYRHVVY